MVRIYKKIAIITLDEITSDQSPVILECRERDDVVTLAHELPMWYWIEKGYEFPIMRL